MATKKAAKKKVSKSKALKKVTSKTPAHKPSRSRTPAKKAAPAQKAVAPKTRAPKPVAPKVPPAPAVEDAIELLRRTCAKGQMVIDDKTMPLANWLKGQGFATMERQGPTWRLYPTTTGRRHIRNG